jgi:predicted secreted protein
MTMKWKLTTCLLITFLTSVAVAHESTVSYDRINLMMSAESEVDTDLLIAELYSQSEGKRASDVADQVNKAMRWAVNLSKSASGVKVQTLQYNTTPVYQNKTISGWRARQSLRLESANSEKLTDLIGKLQEKLLVHSISYNISRELRLSTEEKLVDQALEAYNGRASAIAGQLGRNGYKIVHLDIGTSGGRPTPIAYRTGRTMSSASIQAPTIQGGVQSISVTVSGSIELLPEQ